MKIAFLSCRGLPVGEPADLFGGLFQGHRAAINTTNENFAKDGLCSTCGLGISTRLPGSERASEWLESLKRYMIATHGSAGRRSWLNTCRSRPPVSRNCVSLHRISQISLLRQTPRSLELVPMRRDVLFRA